MQRNNSVHHRENNNRDSGDFSDTQTTQVHTGNTTHVTAATPSHSQSRPNSALSNSQLPNPALTRRLSREQSFDEQQHYAVPAPTLYATPIKTADFDIAAISPREAAALTRHKSSSSLSLRDAAAAVPLPSNSGNVNSVNSGVYSPPSGGGTGGVQQTHPGPTHVRRPSSNLLPPVPSSPKLGAAGPSSASLHSLGIPIPPATTTTTATTIATPADHQPATAAMVNALHSRFESVLRDLQEKVAAQADLLERMFAYVIKIDKEAESVNDEVALLRQQMSALAAVKRE
ncbi:hypothetical protein HK100_005653 [Physocladia obscura]|uniref:Uncharacterized protein n=1 Tax=Physocladia obscura TaxID=109957 RepID=A0AAD5X7Z1_9FUNG|nr:hypothetical protein HK100_005653 [Physocladia obscura]